MSSGGATVILERTHNSLVADCNSYAVVFDPKPAATDYHIVIADGHDNAVRGCLAENLHSDHTDTHPGYGIGIRDQAGSRDYPHPHSYNNRMANCDTRSLGEYLFVAHEAYDNEFVNCTAIGHWRTQNRWSEGTNIRDGAHDNTFRDCRVEGTWTSVAIQDTVEGPKTPDGSAVVQTCSRNTLANCRFADSHTGIELWRADGNVFRSCLFGNVEAALVYFPLDRKSQGNRCRNATVTTVRGAYQQVDKGTRDEVLFTHSNFWANSFSMPAGEGNEVRETLAVDAAKGE
jgi:parallel beta-helix repeat protein